jgi:hypothetical protein
MYFISKQWFPPSSNRTPNQLEKNVMMHFCKTLLQLWIKKPSWTKHKHGCLTSSSSENVTTCYPGLPDDTYVCIPKIPIWVYFGGPCNKKCLYIYCMAIWNILWPLGIFVVIWCILPREIWQPCCYRPQRQIIGWSTKVYIDCKGLQTWQEKVLES